MLAGSRVHVTSWEQAETCGGRTGRFGADTEQALTRGESELPGPRFSHEKSKGWSNKTFNFHGCKSPVKRGFMLARKLRTRSRSRRCTPPSATPGGKGEMSAVGSGARFPMSSRGEDDVSVWKEFTLAIHTGGGRR